MNKKNLIKAVEHLLTVPKERFNIREFRLDYEGKNADKTNPICETVGCGAGHLTAIIPQEQIIYNMAGTIDFFSTTLRYLRLNMFRWDYLFSQFWENFDNSLYGICQRIIYLIKNNKIPSDYFDCSHYNTINVEAELVEIKKSIQ